MKRRKSKKPGRRRILLWFVILAILVAVSVAAGRAGFDWGGLGRDLLGQARSLRDRVTQRQDEALPQEAGPGEGAGGGAVTPHVAVYFAPVAHVERGGIDDQFLAFVQGARQSVFCAFYELEWMEAARALIAQHEAGLSVAIVTDSDYGERDALKACAAAGIPVVLDKRNAFMHDKFCVVDGARVWTGSTNITDNGLYRNDNNSLVIASSELAANFTGEFNEMFENHKFGPRSPRGCPYPVVVVDGISMETYFAPEDDVRAKIVRQLDEAKRSIDFMAFSFTANELASAMQQRMKQGVRVRGIFESRNASSRYSDDDALKRAGAQIHMDKNAYAMHNKVIVIDGATVVTGSYNFSNNAEHDNDENVLVLHSPALAERYTRRFEKLFQ